MKSTEVAMLLLKGVEQADKPDIKTDMKMEYDRAITAVYSWMVEVFKMELDSCPELEENV